MSAVFPDQARGIRIFLAGGVSQQDLRQFLVQIETKFDGKLSSFQASCVGRERTFLF